jgi:cytidyltransferase-like protein
LLDSSINPIINGQLLSYPCVRVTVSFFITTFAHFIFCTNNMQLITTKKALFEVVSNAKSAGKTIGFVPTMGALHNGHLTLVKRCVSENDLCFVSVFVNPTQFNDKNDLANYPRTLEAAVPARARVCTQIIKRKHFQST